jgi:hypothetical protein
LQSNIRDVGLCSFLGVVPSVIRDRYGKGNVMRYVPRIAVIVCALLMAGFLSPAGAAKPVAGGELRLVGIDFAPTSEDACAGRAAVAIDGDGRYVSHSLTVKKGATVLTTVGAEKVRVPRDSFAELFVTLEGKAGAKLTYEYGAELFLNLNDSVALDTDSWAVTKFCDVPSTVGYLDGFPEAAGRWWNAAVVAGDWGDPDLKGKFVVNDTEGPLVEGVYDEGGDTTDFRLEGISKKVSSVEFILVFSDGREDISRIITR